MTKSIFPYDKLQSLEYLERPDFPDYEDFFSVLTQSIPITRDEHAQGARVFERFQLRSLKEYLLLYNLVDTYCMAEACLKYDKTMHASFGLYPMRFISLPGFGFSAFLRSTGVEIEQLTDHSMYLFFEKSLRGGLSVVATRYARAVEGESALSLYDYNNLYGRVLFNNFGKLDKTLSFPLDKRSVIPCL